MIIDPRVFQFGEGNRMYVHGEQVVLKRQVLSILEEAECYVAEATRGRALRNHGEVLAMLRSVLSDL